MTRICHEKTGLFPSPAEISFTCSCPDWASMCKHVAAVLYGIGARLDQTPDLLFDLRKVNHQDLVAQSGQDLTAGRKGPGTGKVLDADLSEIFGIEMAQVAARPEAAGPPAAKPRPPTARRKKSPVRVKPAAARRRKKR